MLGFARRRHVPQLFVHAFATQTGLLRRQIGDAADPGSEGGALVKTGFDFELPEQVTDHAVGDGVGFIRGRGLGLFPGTALKHRQANDATENAGGKLSCVQLSPKSVLVAKTEPKPAGTMLNILCSIGMTHRNEEPMSTSLSKGVSKGVGGKGDSEYNPVG